MLNGCAEPDSLNMAVILLLAITLTTTRPWLRLFEDSSGDLPVVGCNSQVTQKESINRLT